MQTLSLVLASALLLEASIDEEFPLGGYHSYWTAYINISYADQAHQVWHTEKTETGRFGNNGLKENEGVAVKMLTENEDNFGCDPPFLDNYPHREKWIAILERGECTFNQKIANALNLNASGVLIYDKEDEGALQSMQVENFPIPAVFTYRWKGQELLSLMNNVSQVYINLQKGSHCFSRGRSRNVSKEDTVSTFLYCTPPESDLKHLSQVVKSYDGFGDGSGALWSWNFSHSNGASDSDTFNMEKRTSVLFVSVSFVVLLIISLAWLIFYYVQRFRYMHAKDKLERQLCSQAKRALSIISTSVLKKDDIEMKECSECAVCIEAYRVADVVRILPCKHLFHKSCIDQWLLEKRTCPMCKMDILKYYGLIEEENVSDREDAAMNLAS